MRHAERLVNTSVSVRDAERMPKWWRSQPSRHGSPTLFATWSLPSLFAVRISNCCVRKIFTIYSIIRILHDLDKRYRRVLLCGISGTIYYLQGFIARFLFLRFITHIHSSWVFEIFYVFSHVRDKNEIFIVIYFKLWFSYHFESYNSIIFVLLRILIIGDK